MTSASSKRAPVRRFFTLLFLLSIPFYAIGAAGGRLPIATFLPVSAIMTFVPMIAALILVARENGWPGVWTLVASAFDFGALDRVGWFVAAIAIMPLLFLIQFGLLRISGAATTDIEIFPMGQVILFLLMFIVGAIGEELGWQAYAFRKLYEQMNAVRAALIVGAVWAVWHVIPYIEMGREPHWIVWHCLSTIVLRMLIVWFFLKTGQSMQVAILIHVMINMPWGVLENYNDYYDPPIAFVTYALTAIVLFGVMDRALARRRRT